MRKMYGGKESVLPAGNLLLLINVIIFCLGVGPGWGRRGAQVPYCPERDLEKREEERGRFAETRKKVNRECFRRGKRGLHILLSDIKCVWL